MAAILFTDADGAWKLHNGKPFPASRFAGWTPDSMPFGEAAPRQSDGAITMLRLRDDFAVSFEVPLIPSWRSYNAFVRSEEFDHAAWVKTAATIVANAAVAPDGSLTADKLVENSATSGHLVHQSMAAATSNIEQPITFRVKAAERIWVAVQLTLKDGNDVRAWFNLSTGAWGTIQPGINAVAYRFLGNGWWELTISENISAGATTPLGTLRLADSDGNSSYTGDGASGVYLWGGQWDRDRDAGVASTYLYTDGTERVGISLLEVADRLRYHLLNGGTCAVYPNDAAASSYTTCGLRPGTVPQLTLTDRRTLEYTLSLQLLNLAASPSRMLARYIEQ